MIWIVTLNFFLFQVTRRRRYIVLLYIFTSFFVDITSSLETPSFSLHRSKREIYFRPLFVYKQQQKRYRKRLMKIHEIYLQQQNSDQQHLENYPTVLINNEFYQSVPLNQLSNPQQYEQQYYQQYYNKYFQQNHPQNIYNVLWIIKTKIIKLWEESELSLIILLLFSTYFSLSKFHRHHSRSLFLKTNLENAIVLLGNKDHEMVLV